MGKILLFYKYVTIDNTVNIMRWQKSICATLGLTGRVIIATEGINATVAGTREATEEYMRLMNEHPLFGGIDFKEAEGGARHFPRMRVVVKPEIVKLGIDPQELTIANRGEYVTPEEAHALMAAAPSDLVILDARNNYESRIGTFTNSLTPDINTFREFPTYVDENLDQFKDKVVLMHCTGGIRCERASAYLNTKQVAKKVLHIEGGIHRYIEKYPEGFFRGSNYVFDARLSHRANNDILSGCDLCQTPCDVYLNCRNAQCNKQYLCCESCYRTYTECCSAQCKQLVDEKKVIVRVKPNRIDPVYAP